MITRLYADNYRCFSNFEVKFGPLTILLGPNGSGKSACLGLLAGLRDLILGRVSVPVLFPVESRTRWDQRLIQNFAIDISVEAGVYAYKLTVFQADKKTWRLESSLNHILNESLHLDGQLLYEANVDGIKIYKDDGKESESLLPDRWNSGISRIPERSYNRKLTNFRDFFATLPVIALNPYAINPATLKKETVALPSEDCADFTDFLANLIVSDAQVMRPVEEALKTGPLPNLKAFEAPLSGDFRIVQCLFENVSGSPVRYRLDELSSGQIATIILQTVATFVEEHNGALILDEPGNFLAVSEMQPFLSQLESLALEHGRQVIISTHHPLAIDFLAAGHGLWFERDPGGPTRTPVRLEVKDEDTNENSYLRISDLIARGWLSGIGIATPND